MQATRSILIAMAALGCALPIARAAPPAGAASPPQAARQEAAQHVVFGKLRSIAGSMMSIETRSKTVIQVDTKPAADSQRMNVPPIGRAVRVNGSYDAKGVLHADTVQRAKDSEQLWPADN